MQNHTDSNRRIARNMLLLYFRMILTMCITLYTSRVILAALGVEDFGIYNIVAGVVVLFSFLNYRLLNPNCIKPHEVAFDYNTDV